MNREHRREQLREQAKLFHAEHPEVWTWFSQFAFDRIRLGYKHYSADAIMHRVRWETDAGSHSTPKINNNFVAFYARAFMKRYPEHDGFFRTRHLV